MSKHTKEEVLAVPEPVFTNTWHPIAHRRLVETIDRGLEQIGVGVRHENFTLTRDGKNLFGSYVLDLEKSGMLYTLGFRNALDKRFGVGICSGTQVIVCSNLQFWADDFNIFHKHTSGLTDDRLIDLVDSALTGALVEMEKVVTWQDGLKERWLPKDEFKQYTFDLLQNGVVSPSNFTKYLDSVEVEVNTNNQIRRAINIQNAEGVRLFDAHGGATRLARSWSQERILNATGKLRGVTDRYLPS